MAATATTTKCCVLGDQNGSRALVYRPLHYNDTCVYTTHTVGERERENRS